MAEWRPIAVAPHDRFIDSFDAYNGVRRVTWYNEDAEGAPACPWDGWDGNWGAGPTHFKLLPELPDGRTIFKSGSEQNAK